MIEAMCTTANCGQYDWADDISELTPVCPSCHCPRIVYRDGAHVSSELRRYGGARSHKKPNPWGKRGPRAGDTKIRGAYARDSDTEVIG